MAIPHHLYQSLVVSSLHNSRWKFERWDDGPDHKWFVLRGVQGEGSLLRASSSGRIACPAALYPRDRLSAKWGESCVAEARLHVDSRPSVRVPQKVPTLNYQ